MYYNNREGVLRQIVLEEQWDDVETSCEGCVLEQEDNCVKRISPPQDFTVCCPRGQNDMYIFKFKDEL